MARPAPRRHHHRALRWCLAIALVSGLTAQHASAVGSCSRHITDTDISPPPAEAGGALAVSGIDPLLDNRVTTHLYTDTNGQVERIAGGDYAATTLDVDWFIAWRTVDSETANATTVNAVVSQLNAANGGGNAFIAGHLVAGKLGGNPADRANFTTLTSKTNSAMANHGEAVAKAIMERIITHYETTPAWVAANGTKRYKPGILYETKITESPSIAQHEAANPGDPLIANPNINNAANGTTLKGKMPARVETHIRFILHEYETAGGTKTRPGLKPTGSWFDMPQFVFNAVSGQLLPQLPSTNGVENVVDVQVTDNGREIVWKYWNRDN